MKKFLTLILIIFISTTPLIFSGCSKETSINNDIYQLPQYNTMPPEPQTQTASQSNFDINKIKAEDQIKWQFINIQKSNLFSMFFCGGTDSPQPICFFEYGKQLVERANRLGTLICTVEKDFVRFEDVCVQTHLMYPTSQIVTFESDDYIKTHAQSIVDAYNRFQMNKLSNLWSYK